MCVCLCAHVSLVSVSVSASHCCTPRADRDLCDLFPLDDLGLSEQIYPYLYDLYLSLIHI